MCDLLALVAYFASDVSARGAAHDGAIHFSDKVLIASTTFSPSQALSFGSLDYITNHSSPRRSIVRGDCNPLTSLPLGGLPQANSEVISHQIQLGFGLNPTN